MFWQNIQEETWSFWKPIENISTQCAVDEVISTPTHLVIFLSDDERSYNVLFDFSQNFLVYKVAEEACAIRLLYDLDAKYGEGFCNASALYMIENSSYLNWLAKQSEGILDDQNVRHYCFFGVNYLVDVIASKPPVITLAAD